MRDFRKASLLCTLILVEKAGVANDKTLWFTAHKQKSRQEKYPGFKIHGESHTKSKIVQNQWPQKMDPGQTKILKVPSSELLSESDSEPLPDSSDESSSRISTTNSTIIYLLST